MKGSDRDVIAVGVFLFRIFPFILLTADSCNFGVVEELTRVCYFQIALETVLLPILIVTLLARFRNLLDVEITHSVTLCCIMSVHDITCFLTK